MIRSLACAVALAAAPAPAGPVLDADRVVLGRTESVGVTFEVPETADDADRPLRLSVNVGSFGEVTRLAPGRYRAVYVPPASRFPQVALVAVWRETGPEAPVSFLRIPLYGVTSIPVEARRGTELRARIGSEELGTAHADAAGHAVIRAVVPPDVREATLVARLGRGAPSTRTVQVEVPPYNRLTAALVPHALRADGEASARLEVFYDLGGADVPPSRIVVEPSAGEVSLLRAERGRYVYRYVPPARTAAERVDFRVSVKGDPAASAAVRLGLRLPDPERVVLRPPGRAIPADGRAQAPVEVLVLDGAGLGLPVQRVEFLADGLPLEPVEDLGAGVYRARFVAPAEYPPEGLVRLEARVRREAGAPLRAFANYQLAVAPVPMAVAVRVLPDPVPADGRTAARLRLDVRDRAGAPLSGARLFLAVSHGVVGELEEREGAYEASYRPPADLPEGEVVLRIVDRTGTLDRSLNLPLRAPPGRLLLGLRAGFAHSLRSQVGPRGGLDLWVPVRPAGIPLGVGVAGTLGMARQSVGGEGGGPKSESRALFVPIALRVGAEVWSSRRLSVSAGAGAVAAFARVTTSLTGAQEERWGFGATGFGALGLALGPGQAFAEVGYTWAPVRGRDFALDAGGLGLELGYRFRVF